MTDEPLSFLARLKQHHIYRVVVAYAVGAWIVIQVASRVFPWFGWAGAVPILIIILLLGFPVVLVLAWMLIKPKDPAKQDSWQRRHWKQGSVQRSGDEVRINVRLVDTHSGYQRWSEKYDRKLTNIFAIEDDISNAIAGKLRVQLSGGDQVSVLSTTDDPQAHALYLQGIAKIAQRGPALKDAVAFFEQATARDPDYAAAWAGLSQAYELLPWYNLGDWHSSLAKAESAAQHALALNPQLGEAHAALANVLRDRLDYDDAMREYQQALTLNPGSSGIHN